MLKTLYNALLLFLVLTMCASIFDLQEKMSKLMPQDFLNHCKDVMSFPKETQKKHPNIAPEIAEKIKRDTDQLVASITEKAVTEFLDEFAKVYGNKEAVSKFKQKSEATSLKEDIEQIVETLRNDLKLQTQGQSSQNLAKAKVAEAEEFILLSHRTLTEDFSDSILLISRAMDIKPSWNTLKNFISKGCEIAKKDEKKALLRFLQLKSLLIDGVIYVSSNEFSDWKNELNKIDEQVNQYQNAELEKQKTASILTEEINKTINEKVQSNEDIDRIIARVNQLQGQLAKDDLQTRKKIEKWIQNILEKKKIDEIKSVFHSKLKAAQKTDAHSSNYFFTTAQEQLMELKEMAINSVAASEAFAECEKVQKDFQKNLEKNRFDEIIKKIEEVENSKNSIISKLNNYATILPSLRKTQNEFAVAEVQNSFREYTARLELNTAEKVSSVITSSFPKSYPNPEDVASNTQSVKYCEIIASMSSAINSIGEVSNAIDSSEAIKLIEKSLKKAQEEMQKAYRLQQQAFQLKILTIIEGTREKIVELDTYWNTFKEPARKFANFFIPEGYETKPQQIRYVMNSLKEVPLDLCHYSVRKLYEEVYQLGWGLIEPADKLAITETFITSEKLSPANL